MNVDKLCPLNKLTENKKQGKEYCSENWYTMYFRYQQPTKGTSDISCTSTDDRMRLSNDYVDLLSAEL